MSMSLKTSHRLVWLAEVDPVVARLEREARERLELAEALRDGARVAEARRLPASAFRFWPNGSDPVLLDALQAVRPR